MNDTELKQAYKEMFDDVHASDELRGRVLDLKHRKRVITPFKATIGTIAAAVMIFAAVNEYGFEQNTEGVINQTAVSTQMPQAEIMAVKPETTRAPQKAKATKAPAVAKKVYVEAATVAPESTPVTEAQPAVAQSDISIASHTDENEQASYGGRAIVGNDTDNTVENWEISRYYNYIGANIGTLINASYTGPETLEFTVGADGVPTDDMAVLTYLCPNGGTVRVTVSRSAFFDAQLSGSVQEAGNGCIGYKVSAGGVYYQVYTTEMSVDETQGLISSL